MFQSTHPHGVRPKRKSNVFQMRSFNPRTHMGCDAPTLLALKRTMLFQSTHPHGVRHEKDALYKFNLLFQSTHPHGVRLLLVVRRESSQASFNPRTHMGCDVLFHNRFLSLFMFQSTHPHGVRPYRSLMGEDYDWFQSTHPHGVRPGEASRELQRSQVSIHAPTWGATTSARRWRHR